MRKLRYANFTCTCIITKHSIAKQSPSFINRRDIYHQLGTSRENIELVDDERNLVMEFERPRKN